MWNKVGIDFGYKKRLHGGGVFYYKEFLMTSKFDVSEAIKVASAVGTAFKVVKGILAKQPILPLVFAALPALSALQNLKVNELPEEVMDIQESEAHAILAAFYAATK